MTRSNGRFAAAATRKPHARALHARNENRPAHGPRKRATCEPLRPTNEGSTASLHNVSKTMRNDA
eukprot:996807-Lingulodinium_polyedra.AAC.1